MKLIVGLGNPGIEYQFTPHNLGFLTIDQLADDLNVEVRNRNCRALTARSTIGEEPVVLAKPETFMNLSGVSVRELVERLGVRPDADQPVAHIISIKEEVAATPEAAAAEAAAAPAEPEVIKKGKQETEEEAEAPAEKKEKK